MVSAALRKISIIGIHSNRGLTSTMFLLKNLSTQKKTNRETTEKVPRKIKAMGEEKYVENSLVATVQILCNMASFLIHFPKYCF
jgi:hypothetical protein